MITICASYECQCIWHESINWGHYFCLLMETGPPFYMVIRGTAICGKRHISPPTELILLRISKTIYSTTKRNTFTFTTSELSSLHLVSSTWPESTVWREVSVILATPSDKNNSVTNNKIPVTTACKTCFKCEPLGNALVFFKWHSYMASGILIYSLNVGRFCLLQRK